MTWQTLEDSRIIDIIGFGESVDQVLKIIHCLDLLGGLTVTYNVSISPPLSRPIPGIPDSTVWWHLHVITCSNSYLFLQHLGPRTTKLQISHITPQWESLEASFFYFPNANVQRSAFVVPSFLRPFCFPHSVVLQEFHLGFAAGPG